MTTLKSLVDETTNIKNDIVECRDTLRDILISKNIEASDDENKLSTLIDKVSKLGEYDDSKLWLYEEGNEYTNVTGGWNVECKHKDYVSGGKVEKSSKSIKLIGGNTGSSQQYGASFSKKIDFTNYNKLCLNCLEFQNKTQYSHNGGGFFGVVTTNTNWNSVIANTEVKSTGVLSVDIKNVTGLNYVALLGGNNSSFITVNQVWLEK